MLKKIKKILILGITLIMCLGLFAGCSAKYNAVLYDNAGEWILESFLEENVNYQNGDTRLPEATSFIVQNQIEFEHIFSDFPYEVDFENKMLLLYVFSCELGGRSYKIKTIKLENQNLIIEYKLDSRKLFNWSSAPWRRCLVVEMDKVNISSVEFKYIK